MAPSRRPAAPPDESVDVARTLAFVNTLYPRPLETAQESLSSYDALVEWARAQQALSAASADRLTVESRRHPQQAAVAVQRVRDLREAIHGVLAAIEQERPPTAAQLDTLGRWLTDACAHGRLVLHDGRLQWMTGREDALDRIGWELARAAGRLLTTERVQHVRACAADDCGWLFVDDTKNHSRRWCDMKTCGNRAKMRRFRARE